MLTWKQADLGGGVPPAGVNRGHTRAAPGKIHFWAQRECWGVDWNICGEVLAPRRTEGDGRRRRRTVLGLLRNSCSNIRDSFVLTGF